jgi:hypothetical protein
MARRPRTLSESALGDPAAEVLAQNGYREIVDLGWKVRRGWDINAPAPFVRRVGKHGSYLIEHHRVLDHLYRLVGPDGEVAYVSEPYHLDDFAALGALANDGWHVGVDGRALWYPGQTARITFVRKEAT